MKIARVETMIVDIPFVDGGKGEGIGPTTWNKLELALVRLEDDRGNVGWGEGFGYFVTDATKAVIDRMIAPLLEGSVVTDIAAWNLATQKRLHLFGRYGITMYAISGVDMALWDLRAKREGVPLHSLLAGGAATNPGPVPFYASLVRYADSAIAPRVCENALQSGFTDLKLHEITLPEIEACRRAVGDGVPISVDVNCNWSQARALEAIPTLIDLGASWLEEPTFPPEGYSDLADLRGRGLPIAAGENWCTAVQFAAAIAAGAVDLAQPSVTKVGGISEFMRVAAVAAAAGVDLMPHCPYFGPGMHASLHLAAALPGVRQLEWLYVQPEAWPAPIEQLRSGGTVAVPDEPGLGFVPDAAVVQRYRRA
ncbi:MAG TPA: mandelate racemase/muconate lactonizing enzyme family protein [Trueperaceae bacterium]|nr:mandelate racemase/muconate lactonizing enzyme family protein [Trueperaceae bacterium]